MHYMSLPNVISHESECWGQRVLHLSLLSRSAPSHGRGNRAQPRISGCQKSLKPLNGGARHTIELRARRLFECMDAGKGFFFCWRLLGLIPGGAPFSQLSSGAWMIVVLAKQIGWMLSFCKSVVEDMYLQRLEIVTPTWLRIGWTYVGLTLSLLSPTWSCLLDLRR